MRSDSEERGPEVRYAISVVVYHPRQLTYGHWTTESVIWWVIGTTQVCNLDEGVRACLAWIHQQVAPSVGRRHRDAYGYKDGQSMSLSW